MITLAKREVTVEEALEELREFPDAEIQFTARVNSAGWRVWVGLRGGNFYGSTLSEAMERSACGTYHLRSWPR